VVSVIRSLAPGPACQLGICNNIHTHRHTPVSTDQAISQAFCDFFLNFQAQFGKFQ